MKTEQAQQIDIIEQSNRFRNYATDSLFYDSLPLKEKVNKLFVVGDFDGDGRRDTIFQHLFSYRTGKEIDSVPSFEGEGYEWGDDINWYMRQGVTVYLPFKRDTLFGCCPAFGLYCLINIGDINHDGKDEIALAVDYCTFTRVGRCDIYTICKGKWTLLKQFQIHDDAFTWGRDEESPLPFTEIKGYLEKRKGKWHYKDYMEAILSEEYYIDEYPMQVLTLDKCK